MGIWLILKLASVENFRIAFSSLGSSGHIYFLNNLCHEQVNASILHVTENLHLVYCMSGRNPCCFQDCVVSISFFTRLHANKHVFYDLSFHTVCVINN